MTEGASHPLQDRTAIVGIAQTRFAKNLEPTEEELAIEAVLAALDDAGIRAAEVDALSSFTMENLEEVALAKDLGFGDLTFFSQIGYGGGGGCATIAHLAMAIATGQARVGVAWRSRKRGSGQRPWASGDGGPAPTRFGAGDRRNLGEALGPFESRRRDRGAREEIHARQRREQGSVRRGGDGGSPACQPESRGCYVRADHDSRRLLRVALDKRASLPVRQLSRK